MVDMYIYLLGEHATNVLKLSIPAPQRAGSSHHGHSLVVVVAGLRGLGEEGVPGGEERRVTAGRDPGHARHPGPAPVLRLHTRAVPRAAAHVGSLLLLPLVRRVLARARARARILAGTGARARFRARAEAQAPSAAELLVRWLLQ